ncbi:MAG: L,D-transpeptidase family protein [Gammaproteobacteria bacterium]|nr:L,D-transpeptidase family protein [Gammaproteobacteria bacterium]MYD00921.1 L,D-transpeptidase family protein [Gammaproteobacteria bacterium]MYI25015.1 L,D-transpeptidase family protein [Gammaproteobacteria bacterium]
MRITSFGLTVLLAGTFAVLPAGAETFLLPSPAATVVGESHWINADRRESLLDAARRNGLGFFDMKQANPDVDMWVPRDGARVLLPTSFILPNARRRGVVVNIAEYRLYFYHERDGQDMVATFPISIGRMDWQTPLGDWRVTRKRTRPTWRPPKSIIAEYAADGEVLPPVVPPGPDNPLGDYAINLSAPGYLIHGTNKPRGVGMQVTHGCLRMLPEDIEWLFPQVPTGLPVTIVNQPVKIGWRDGRLYLEAHPALEDRGAEEIDSLIERISASAQAARVALDVQSMRRVLIERRGVPTPISLSREQVQAAAVGR